MFGRVDHSVDAAQQGRFTAPRRADDTSYFFIVQRKIDVFENMVVADIDIQVLDLDNGVFITPAFLGERDFLFLPVYRVKCPNMLNRDFSFSII